MVYLEPGETICLRLDDINVKTTDAVNIKYVKYKDRVNCLVSNKSIIFYKYEGMFSKKERTIDKINFDSIYEQNLDNLNYVQASLKWKDQHGRTYQTDINGPLINLIKHIEQHFSSNHTNSQNATASLSRIEVERVKEVIKIRCQYCRNLYDGNLANCPHCGGH